MQSKILCIFTRTPLHVGAGASVGAIDQPIQRERHTGFPTIPGSSIKGVLRDHLKTIGPDAIDKLFGKGGDDKDSRAGDLSFGEARLVAFPVRSAKGAFALAVSPLSLRRLARDAGWDLKVPDVPVDMTCLAGGKLVIPGKNAVVLEEYRFNVTGEFPKDWENKLTSLLDDAVLSGAAGRLVLLSDGDLAHFALNACQVNQHVRIDDTTGTADDGGLFNEETVPSEALFYAVLTVLHRGSEDNEAFKKLSEEQLVQFGGDGTTGLGFCTIKLA
ncbi:MAG: type III-B CRISPR module RAMP protein Cmr4 [Verrucomicrobia bacterium]|nr:type III-B CRISPR module RAMP protein Cmr4 [Verrucomicrobiota bacterium]